ncbi:MAG: helix-turn-helix transcriptional regulator [Desulfobacter sp.]|nr:helix-turn-helix transcriptional regulator [Desulfobacter sp.]WDP85851.1 MAG: helix-turn-helix transcriptional regulator [Desulfobacter sp.]
MHLTGTEIQVANFICHGKTTKEIATLMGVAETTINTHRSHIRNKIGIRNEKVSLKSFLFSLS